MYCLIMHITPKKKTLYIKTWIKTTTHSTPEHSYICNAVASVNELGVFGFDLLDTVVLSILIASYRRRYTLLPKSKI